MKPSSASGKVSPAKARNAVLLNLLATPGLGSIMAGRWLAGTGQLLLSLGGCALILIWFVKVMVPYYNLMFSSTEPPPINWLTLKWGAAIFGISWIWSLFTSISIYNSVSRANAETLKAFGSNRAAVDQTNIQAKLVSVPNWQRAGPAISRTYEFADFVSAMKFVNAVAAAAEQAQHHPDIDVRWNKVTLALTTHDAGGLTDKDFAMAKQCDALR